MRGICYIVGACGKEELYLPKAGKKLVIAADGGLEALTAQGIAPDLILGDFDSLGRVPEGKNVLRYPVEKDDTDSMLAIKEGLCRGYSTFILYGCLGGRMDHTYANMQALGYLAEHGAVGYLLGDGWAASAIKEGAVSFPAGLHGTASVFCPGGEAKGVSIRGLYYCLEDGTLQSSFPLGVSNHFTGEAAEVSVREGALLLMWQEEAEHLVDRLL